MKIEKTDFDGLLVLTPKIFSDKRGYFFESFNRDKYRKLGLPDFVQENQSYSKKHVFRGMHLQKKPHAQGKLVRVIKGKVVDMVVDLRPKSKTYMKTFSIQISARNKKELYVPPGFAHGFFVLSNEAIFSYLCTDTYHHETEVGLLYKDFKFNIDFPNDMIISDKDMANIRLKDFLKN